MIIIYQSSTFGRFIFGDITDQLNLSEGKDFVYASQLFNVGQLTTADQDLLITGSFNGSTEGIESVITQLRASHQKLVTVSYSIERLPGKFEVAINKFSIKAPAELKRVITEFLSGKLKRID